MFYSIGKDDIAGIDHRVVSHSLRESLLREVDVGGFALRQKKRPVAIDDHNIGTLVLTIQQHGVLLDNLCRRSRMFVEEVFDKMPAHPLFGGENKITTPHGAPHHQCVAIFLTLSTEFYGRKV